MHGHLDGLRIEKFFDDGTYPNSQLPLLFYEAALPRDETDPEAMEALFAANGWPPAWRSSVFTYHHYHSTAHETLGVARGSARLMLGGPEGREFDVEPGDVIVIPAGVAHRRLDSSSDFLVVGCYPPGQTWDLLRGESGDRPMADQNIARVPRPATDPVAGSAGPLLTHWILHGKTS
jgi:uncharacterized protein YjlB